MKNNFKYSKTYIDKYGTKKTFRSYRSPSTNAIEKETYNHDTRKTTRHGGGPCGPSTYDEYGREC